MKNNEDDEWMHHYKVIDLLECVEASALGSSGYEVKLSSNKIEVHYQINKSTLDKICKSYIDNDKRINPR